MSLPNGTKVYDIHQPRARGTIVGTANYEDTEGYVVELNPRMRAATATGIYIRVIVMAKDGVKPYEDNDE